jgi:hypothetical protein
MNHKYLNQTYLLYRPVIYIFTIISKQTKTTHTHVHTNILFRQQKKTDNYDLTIYTCML